MKRASKRDMELRGREISDRIAIGFKRAEIADELAGLFKVSRKAIERQYDRIIKDWIEQDKDRLDTAKAGYIMQLKYLHKKAIESGQWKVAAEIIEKQAKMMGIYSPKAQEHEEKPSINIIPKGLKVVPQAGNVS